MQGSDVRQPDVKAIFMGNFNGAVAPKRPFVSSRLAIGEQNVWSYVKVETYGCMANHEKYPICDTSHTLSYFYAVSIGYSALAEFEDFFYIYL